MMRACRSLSSSTPKHDGLHELLGELSLRHVQKATGLARTARVLPAES